MRSSRKLIAVFIAGLFYVAILTVTAQRRSENNLPKSLVQQLILDINDNKNNFCLSDEDLKVLHENLKFELHDLNADGVSEYFLYIDHSDWCGAGSNCSYWVYQKAENGYKLLVEDKVLRVKETVTNGYRDLSSEHKTGSCENGFLYFITPYKFNGENYQSEKIINDCRVYKPEGN
ncbi:MAG: hypothetical protein R2747_15820 [Pyrinomonadaceae bacterium]